MFRGLLETKNLTLPQKNKKSRPRWQEEEVTQTIWQRIEGVRWQGLLFSLLCAFLIYLSAVIIFFFFSKQIAVGVSKWCTFILKEEKVESYQGRNKLLFLLNFTVKKILSRSKTMVFKHKYFPPTHSWAVCTHPPSKNQIHTTNSIFLVRQLLINESSFL